MDHGPLSASMLMGGSFDEDDIYSCPSNSSANHAVVIVGYDDTEGYWIVRNSWGAGWGRPHNLLMRALSLPVRLGDRLDRTTDNLKGLLPDLLRSAGFEEVLERARFATLFGTLSLYSARKPVGVT